MELLPPRMCPLALGTPLSLGMGVRYIDVSECGQESLLGQKIGVAIRNATSFKHKNSIWLWQGTIGSATSYKGKPMEHWEFHANELKMMYLFSKVNKLVQHLPSVVNNQAGEKRKPIGSNCYHLM